MIHAPCFGYKLVFTHEASKDLKKLEHQVASKILDKIKELTLESINHLNIKKLKTNAPLYRLRVGDHRIIYSIEHKKVVIYIVAIGHRKDIYKNIEKRF